MNKLFFSLLLLIGLCVVPINAQNRWSINPNGSISWEVKGRIPH